MPELSTDIRYIKGIGSQRAKLFNKLGIFSYGDLISYFPRDYEDRTVIKTISELHPGENACVQAAVQASPKLRRIRAGMDIVNVRVADDKGSMEITFFNQSYVKNMLKEGQSYIFYGPVSGNLLGPAMVNPIFEKESAKGERTGRIVPIYPLCAGLSRNMVRNAVQNAMEVCRDSLPDILPDGLRTAYHLAHARFAYENIHFPRSFEALETARHRLIFEELLELSIGMRLLRSRRTGVAGPKMEPADLSGYLQALPFQLTGAQERAIREITADMASGGCMNRLVQGDVGSGKTAVAAAAAYIAAGSGFQSALMAPTEILAEQHFSGLSGLLEKCGLRVSLLTGSMTKTRKEEVYGKLFSGETNLVIGTHALLSEGVEFARLGLVITDEQHRFGVQQRARLTAKGERPHVLVMSATPIPRTLALIMYGDLEISLIDELPPGRQNIDTFTVGEAMRPRIEAFVRRLAGEGRQVYIVCSLVQDQPESAAQLKAVKEYAQQLQSEIYPALKVGYVHGKMSAKDKNAAMRAFVSGQTDILVATTVIEVGVDVPNAALMVVENAERFGLSQLHQLRGRVGRGKHKSYCVLFSDSENERTKARLAVMVRTNDGFAIAEEDLKLRGPGDFFGSRQHGMPQLKIADLSYDVQILKQAQEAAGELMEKDPQMSRTEHQGLKNKVRELFNPSGEGDIFN